MPRLLPLMFAAPAVLLVGALFIVPVAKILAISFAEPVPGFGNYVSLFTEPLYQKIVATTVRVCVLTTVFAVVLGYIVAYVMSNVSARARNWMLIFLLVPFWISVLVRAFAWVFLLAREGFVNSTLIALGLIDQPLVLLRSETGVLIGMVHYMIPYAVLPMLTNMSGIDRSLLTASRSLGAGPIRTFLRVWFPLSLPGILSAAVLVFIFCLGFFITPALLGGGKTIMVAQFIEFGISETLNWGIATAFASTLLMTVALSLVLVTRVVRVKNLYGAP